MMSKLRIWSAHHINHPKCIAKLPAGLRGAFLILSPPVARLRPVRLSREHGASAEKAKIGVF